MLQLLQSILKEGKVFGLKKYRWRETDSVGERQTALERDRQRWRETDTVGERQTPFKFISSLSISHCPPSSYHIPFTYPFPIIQLKQYNRYGMTHST